MPEGTVAFPQEVLLRVQTKKDEALLLETCMSMIMNHESLIATKARRVRTVAGKDNLMGNLVCAGLRGNRPASTVPGRL